ncbi:MAG TPA: signal recognition particle-docking protein FtsY [Pirellulales bacterium]|jgi:fused signal recognition particle receptor|nr:signal recognition particle-docking protein FtsY [Pirellulales bacterium]
MGLFDKFKKPAAAATPVSPAPPKPADAPATEPAKPSGVFGRLKQGLKKTHQILFTDVRDLFKKEGRLVSDEFLEELRAVLIKTDMGPAAAEQIVNQIGTDFRARVVHMSDVIGIVAQQLKQLMAQDAAPLRTAAEGPTVIMIAGVNGSGKTTSIAKLTRFFSSQGQRVVLGAGDTFRAAAIEQLSEWARRLDAQIVTGTPGSDPASVAHRAVATAVEQNADVCIIDTAGRLQTQQNLMAELTKIQRVIAKRIPDAPHEVLLVLDATGGQNGVSQARGFAAAVQCTGIILAKLDGTAKGGVIVPIRQQFALPVKFIGTGEKPDDFAPFDPETFVDAMLADWEEAAAK